MANKCDLCDKEYIKTDGTKGNGDVDSLMVNDYLTMTEWYKNHKSDQFMIKRPNPYACRRCVKLLLDAGLRSFIGGNPEKFLTTDKWWE